MSTTPQSRNIIILLDGTGNQFSDHNSNLIKLLSVIKADESQLVYYSSGLGTVLPESTSTWGHIRQKAAQMIDMGLAWNFDEFVCDAYKFLMDYYKSGDKIYLFGFSRGAYTARALAGMIQRVGLLPAGNHNQVTLAYEMYTGPEIAKGKDEKDPSVLYRRIFGRSRPVAVEFLGVWDTVSSIGGFDLPQLPFASGAKSIKIFRHALALDERRAKFVPEYWRKDDDEIQLEHDISATELKLKSNPSDKTLQDKLADLKKIKEKKHPTTVMVNGGKKEVLKNVECWFMGCHSDVGGGNTLNDYPSLSNIPFRWMLREATQCGLLLDPEGTASQSALSSITPSIPNSTLSSEAMTALTRLRNLVDLQSHDAKLETEQEEEVEKLRKSLTQEVLVKVVEMAAGYDSSSAEISKDGLAGMNESLEGAWVLLEKLVFKTRQYTADGVEKDDEVKINNGDGRQIVPGQKCHRSVLRRLMYEANKSNIIDKKTQYKGPSADGAKGWPTWEEVKKGQATKSEIWLE